MGICYIYVTVFYEGYAMKFIPVLLVSLFLTACLSMPDEGTGNIYAYGAGERHPLLTNLKQQRPHSCDYTSIKVTISNENDEIGEQYTLHQDPRCVENPDAVVQEQVEEKEHVIFIGRGTSQERITIPANQKYTFIKEYHVQPTTKTTNNPFYDEKIDEIMISSEKKAVGTTKKSNATKKPTKNQTANKKPTTKKSTTKAPTIKGKVNCSKFANHAAAQAYFEARKHGWKGLDRDSDGIACEHLD